ncbi:MAG: hypothetical protein M3R37_06830 [Actinomycetota bacterium]|nr:hypothetical protein [Actinomycetota bacterium]
MTHPPDFDDLVGRDVPDEERARLMRAHRLLVEAGAPPELSPELDSVPWPEASQVPLLKPKQGRPLLLAAAIATAIGIGFVLGQATGPSTGSISAVRVVKLAGTKLDSDARASIELGKADASGNWPMLLRARGLQELPEGGYYDLYLTKDGKPVVLCGTFNVKGDEIIVRFSAAYDLKHLDKDGWVITRQLPGNHEPTEVVLRPTPV